ncbi:uncharacterized protein SOCE26_079220 [Sorangium cellulosum]|uniref:Secreted protein n=1 Tax=Sorangium cellulosum TaxID=56 RepID=A0A2L0F4E2_SORCE|nr:hypothetical protein [Sorangium cellulosum]AUX46416.1 uncharacterized protein SOCE26_079220 [Sorangium cellulosum]
MRFISVFSASVLFLLAACAPLDEDEGSDLPSSGDAQGAAIEGDDGDTAASAQRLDGSELAPKGPVGEWISPSCGTRKYARTIRFDARGTFLGQDLVSPCPPDVVCIWSGIVSTRGTYTVEEDTIFLSMLNHGAGPAAPFPTELGIDAETSAPVETDHEGNACVYEPYVETGPRPRPRG